MGFVRFRNDFFFLYFSLYKNGDGFLIYYTSCCRVHTFRKNVGERNFLIILLSLLTIQPTISAAMPRETYLRIPSIKGLPAVCGWRDCELRIASFLFGLSGVSIYRLQLTHIMYTRVFFFLYNIRIKVYIYYYSFKLSRFCSLGSNKMFN